MDISKTQEDNLSHAVFEKCKLVEDYFKKYYPQIKNSHFETLVDIIFMAAIRNKLDITLLIQDLHKGILDLNKFYGACSGNIYDFIMPKYVSFAKRIKDITVGSNGGMANVGKGEWLISICSGIDPKKGIPRVGIIKNGKGDLIYLDKETEEVKWNGGKVSVEIPGEKATKKFNTLIDIKDKGWVPFRITDVAKYSEKEISNYNAVYWNAISEENVVSLSNNELKKKIINMAFEKVFNNCSTFIMFNDNGTFRRFRNTDEANLYYQDKLEQLLGSRKGFECRAKQRNPIALYCYVF